MKRVVLALAVGGEARGHWQNGYGGTRGEKVMGK